MEGTQINQNNQGAPNPTIPPQQPNPKMIPGTPPEGYVNARLVAKNLYDQAKDTRMACLIGIVGMMIVMTLSIFGKYTGAGGTVIFSAILTFFVYRVTKTIRYLNNKYYIEPHKFNRKIQ